MNYRTPVRYLWENCSACGKYPDTFGEVEVTHSVLIRKNDLSVSSMLFVHPSQ